MRFISLITLLLFTPTIDAKIYCKQMHSCQEACSYFLQGYSRLDRDKDNIPCENVCDAPCQKKKEKKKTKKNSSS